MADTLGPPDLSGRPAASAKKAPIAKMAGIVAKHAYMSLAIIIVLVILVLGMHIYYHGFLFLGPYAKPSKGGFRSAKSNKRKGADDADAESQKGDPETERLIDSINSR
jgi:hypothetical protein